MCCPLLQNLDITVFYFLNSRIKNGLLDLLLPVFTEVGSVYFIVGLGLVLILLRNKKLKHLGILVLAAVWYPKRFPAC